MSSFNQLLPQRNLPERTNWPNSSSNDISAPVTLSPKGGDPALDSIRIAPRIRLRQRTTCAGADLSSPFTTAWWLPSTRCSMAIIKDFWLKVAVRKTCDERESTAFPGIGLPYERIYLKKMSCTMRCPA